MSSDARDMNVRSKASCDGCRRRKVKCDSSERGDGRSCTKCEAADIECKFTYTRKKRRPNLAPRSRKYGLDTAQVLVEHIVSSLDDYSIPQDSETIREMLVSLAQYARSLELQMTRSVRAGRTASSPIVLSGDSSNSPESQTVSPDIISLSGTNSEKEDSDEELLADFKTLSVGPQKRHYGRSSNYLFLHTAMEIKEGFLVKPAPAYSEKIVMRPEFWLTDIWKWLPDTPSPTYKFPDNDLLFNLIDIYFNEISPYLCLLHAPTFREAVTSGLHIVNPGFGATVLAVCALASRHSDDPRNHINETDYEQLVGWKWFRQIRLVRPHFTQTTSIYELQLYCLASEFLSSTTIADGCWPLIGLGIRLAQERGVHRAKPGQARSAESELWLRAFWCLLGLDVVQGLTVGRPPATTPTDCDVEEVCEADDEFWKTAFEEPFVQPAGKPSTVSFAVHYNRLLQIAGSIQRTIYAIKRPDTDQLSYKHHHGTSNIEWNQRVVVKHDSALNDWLDSLPEHLRWDPHRSDPVFFSQTVVLHTAFYWVQMQLHKKFVMRIVKTPTNSPSDPDSGSSPELGTGTNGGSTANLASMEMKMSFPSLAVCANAARSTVNIAQAHHQRGLHPLPTILPYLGNAAATLLVTLWRSKHSIGSGSAASKRELGDLRRCFAILQAYEGKHQGCGRLYDKFSALLRAEELDSVPAPLQPSGSKRTRPDEADEEDQDQATILDWPSGALDQGQSSSSVNLLAQRQPVRGVSSAQVLSSNSLVETPVTDVTTTSIWSNLYAMTNSNNSIYNSNSNVSLNGFTSSGFATRSALDGLEIWSDLPPNSISDMESASSAVANGRTTLAEGGDRSLSDIVVPQNQTRPLRADEVGNGMYDALYQFTGGANANGFGAVLSEIDGSTSTMDGKSDQLESSLNLSSSDLEEWNTFMKNVDEALFEVGLGR